MALRQDSYELIFNINWGNTGWVWENTEEREWIDSILQKTIQNPTVPHICKIK